MLPLLFRPRLPHSPTEGNRGRFLDLEMLLVAGICETLAPNTPRAHNSLWFGTWVLVKRQVWEAPRFPVLWPTSDPGTVNHPSAFWSAIPGQE